MKGLVLTTVILLVPLLGLILWLYRPRLALLRARLSLALKVTAVLYLALIAFRLAASGIDQRQLQVAGLSLVFFAGLWVVAWLVTRNLARDR